MKPPRILKSILKTDATICASNLYCNPQNADSKHPNTDRVLPSYGRGCNSIIIFYHLVSAKYGGSNLIMKELVNNEQGDQEIHAFYSLKIFLGQCD